MDVARRIRMEDIEEIRARQRVAFVGVTPPEHIEKVVRLQTAPREAMATGEPPALTAAEIERAFDLVHEAARQLRSAEERVRDAENRNRSVVHRASEELKAAETRLQAADARVALAEARAEAAAARAEELEGWLRQIYAAISDQLPTRA